MSHFVNTNVGAYANQYNFSGDMNTAGLTIEAEILDGTTFLGGSTRNHVAGLLNNSLDLAGFVDFAEINTGDADSVDKYMFGALSLTAPIVSLCPEGPYMGERAFFGNFVYSQYNPHGNVGDLMAFDLKAYCSSPLVRGIVANNALIAVTASGTTTKYQLGAVALGTTRLVAHLHVVDFVGTSLSVVVQSDANATAGGETNRVTFTTATDTTFERKTLATAVTDTWWRLNYTFVGTSVKFLVVFGIEEL